MIQRRTSERADWPAALGLLVGFSGLYWLTLCPTVFWYDSAEYVATAATLGLPHPPGYPLYTLIAHLFSRLPLDVAKAVNLLSAVSGALAVALAYGVGRLLGARPLAALIGSLTLGLSGVFWFQSLIAETYTPGLVVIGAVTVLLVLAIQRQRAWLAVVAALLGGLGLGVHMFGATCGVGWLLLVLGTTQRVKGPRWLLPLGCLAAVIAGSAVFLYLPWRAAQNPVVAFDDLPSWENFWWYVSGGNYKLKFAAEIDRIRRAGDIASLLYDELLPVGLVLACAGVVGLVVKQRLVGGAIALMALGNLLFFFDYQVHDLEVFFLPTIWVLCCGVGLGAELVLVQLSRLTEGSPKGRAIGALAALALVLYPLSLGLANYSKVDLSGYTAARDYGERLCRELPRGAIVLSFTTPPEFKSRTVFDLYYRRYLGRRPDVEVRVRVTPEGVARVLGEGRPVYLFYPVPEVVSLFEVPQEGVAFRVARRRPRPIALDELRRRAADSQTEQRTRPP